MLSRGSFEIASIYFRICNLVTYQIQNSLQEVVHVPSQKMHGSFLFYQVDYCQRCSYLGSYCFQVEIYLSISLQDLHRSLFRSL